MTTTLLASDGIAISAQHDPPVSGAVDGLALVVAHGFTGSWRRPATRAIVARLRPQAGVVSFDFRGHGSSAGFSTVGDHEIHDLAAAVAFARSLGYERVATLGFSMGASVVVRHAALLDHELAAVVAVSGPARWYYRGTPAMRRVHHLVEWPVGRLVTRLALHTRIAADGWDPLPEAPHEVVARIAPVPLLVVHGDADHYFPIEHGEQLYAAAAQPKTFWREPGFGHAEVAAARPEAGDLIERIGAWVAATAEAVSWPRPSGGSPS